MKNMIIIVLAVLLAIAGYVIAKDRAPGGPAPSEGGDPSVTPLSSLAEKELGITKADAYVSVVTFNGEIRHFQPSGTAYTQIELPMKKPVTVQRMQSMTLLTFTASPPCVGSGSGNGRSIGQWCPQ